MLVLVRAGAGACWCWCVLVRAGRTRVEVSRSAAAWVTCDESNVIQTARRRLLNLSCLVHAFSRRCYDDMIRAYLTFRIHASRKSPSNCAETLNQLKHYFVILPRAAHRHIGKTQACRTPHSQKRRSGVEKSSTKHPTHLRRTAPSPSSTGRCRRFLPSTQHPGLVEPTR